MNMGEVQNLGQEKQWTQSPAGDEIQIMGWKCGPGPKEKGWRS